MEYSIYTMEVTTTTTNLHRVRATSMEQAADIATVANDAGGFNSEQRVSHEVQVRELPK